MLLPPGWQTDSYGFTGPPVLQPTLIQGPATHVAEVGHRPALSGREGPKAP